MMWGLSDRPHAPSVRMNVMAWRRAITGENMEKKVNQNKRKFKPKTLP
jgi:hypothetical protein